MGLLSQGKPLTWEDTKKYINLIKEQGILQFINAYSKLKDRKTPCLMWGDEIEYMLISFDDKIPKAKVLLEGDLIIEKLNKLLEQTNDSTYIWHPEFASYMVEGTPGQPYKGTMPYYNVVETNMRARRQAIQQMLNSNESVLTISAFPRLGCKDFCEPDYKPTPDRGMMRSLYLPDLVANNSHPRFLTIARNVRSRKGRNVYINIPIYRDINTPKPFRENFEGLGPREIITESLEVSLPNHVYMDCMCFGMGCCCLQVTFQACNIEEARYLYDQLGSLCPIMLALTAATPIFKGYLVDRDCRWDVISGSVDDRTKKELGLEPSKTPIIRKSRYDSIDCYISYMGKPYNDIPLLYDKQYLQKLIEAGVDELLAEHIAHLFIRDPLILYEEKIKQSPDDSDHFENIQSTNWQTMRFKPPPPNTSIGWRVEFRPQEIQLTDFENAAYVVFVVLLTRAILSYNLNFLVPISKMEKNMAEAQERNGLLNGKFWFHYRNYSKKRDVIAREANMERRESGKTLVAINAAIQENNLKYHSEELCPTATCKEVNSNSTPQHKQANGTLCNGNNQITVKSGKNGFCFPADSVSKLILNDVTSIENCAAEEPSLNANALPQKCRCGYYSTDQDDVWGNVKVVPQSPTDTITSETFSNASSTDYNKSSKIDENDWSLMTINHIVNGNNEFPGLIPLVKNFLNNMDLDVNTRCTILKYLKLIEKRASGEIPTMARWMREFVTSHPDYKQDSKVSDLINYDLLKLCDKITKGEIPCPYLSADLLCKSNNQYYQHT